MKPIQVFWLVAVWAADRIAIWPLSPICWAISCTSVRPRSSALAWETKTSRQLALVSES